ncbi:MAG: nucleotide exchange factor GrpE [Nitrospirae bacterium]|nr:nucleotide exchange factor GrpE [Nitrospirota bacterium]
MNNTEQDIPVETDSGAVIDDISKSSESEVIKEPNLLDICLKEKSGLLDKYTRLYAEYENYKKRAIKERDELSKYRAEPLATEILQVLDNLQLALSHVTSSSDDSLVKGVEMTTKELKKILDKFGLSEINAQGKPFDPNFHHAMSMIERDDIENNTVVEIFRKGYLFKDRLIRPAIVSVSKKNKPPELNVLDNGVKGLDG